MADFKISAGSKLSFAEITSGTVGTYTDLTSCTQIPEIGGAPETVETTSLDNAKFRTNTIGLQDLGVLDFPFNLELPSATSNINVVAGLDADELYSWKITYASGITVVFKSKPNYSFNQVGINEIESFALHLAPIEEPVITVPSSH